MRPGGLGSRRSVPRRSGRPGQGRSLCHGTPAASRAAQATTPAARLAASAAASSRCRHARGVRLAGLGELDAAPPFGVRTGPDRRGRRGSGGPRLRGCWICGDLDIDFRAATQQVRPRTQSTITGGLCPMALLIGSYGPTGPAAPNLDIALTARQKAGGKPLGEEREDRMSGVPTAQSPGPAESREPASQRAESSPSRPADETPPLPAETPPLPAEHKRWKRKKIFTPLVLAALGLVLLLLSILFYPSQSTGVSTPPYSRLEITTTSPIFLIGFKVVQVSPALAEMRFTVELPVGKTAPPPGATASLQVAPPLGTSFRDCPAPSCTRVPGVPPT